MNDAEYRREIERGPLEDEKRRRALDPAAEGGGD